jgi:ribosome-binding protein aMBF1 (putative translation factor)
VAKFCYFLWSILRGLAVYKTAFLRAMEDNFNEVCRQLGKRVTTLRKQIGISQEELAFRAEIDRTYISQIERGVCNPSLLVLCKVSSVLGVELVNFFEGFCS